ncbi:MAG: lecithin retinol acyltransferase family protein [Rubripirellula sp.]
MARGDHFFVWRQRKGVPFQHHGIDLGDNSVVHFTDGAGGVAGPGSSSEFEVKQTPFESVTRGGQDSVHFIDYSNHLPREAIVSRALSQVGRRGYHLVFDNCEHFACWCVTGKDESRQIDVACVRMGSASIKAIAAGSARVASRAGIRGISPWILVADAAQWTTEVGGHHVGFRDPQRRKQAGRAVGMATALGVGACGGPVGIAVSGGLWAAGEVAGEVTRVTYGRLRERRQP